MISVIVLTKNEERNIKECLKSVNWCDEIIIVDDYSEDDTIEIAKNFGAKVYQRHLAGDFSGQRNFALRQTQGEWVFFLDADERVSSNLRREIITRFKSSKVQGFNGFYLKRNDYFGGKWLKFGETANVKLIRLAKKGAGIWKRQVHEIWEVKGKIGAIKAPILHYPHPTICEFLDSVNFHSTLHAEALFEEKTKTNFLKPLAKFIQNYFLKFGFLDGTQGLIMALMMSFHSFLAQSKLYLKWKK